MHLSKIVVIDAINLWLNQPEREVLVSDPMQSFHGQDLDAKDIQSNNGDFVIDVSRTTRPQRTSE